MQYLLSKPKSVDISWRLLATLTIQTHILTFCSANTIPTPYFPTKPLICSAKETKPKKVNAACLTWQRFSLNRSIVSDSKKQRIWLITTHRSVLVELNHPSPTSSLCRLWYSLHYFIWLAAITITTALGGRRQMWVVISCFHSRLIWLGFFFLMTTSWHNGYPHNGYLGERLPLWCSFALHTDRMKEMWWSIFPLALRFCIHMQIYVYKDYPDKIRSKPRGVLSSAMTHSPPFVPTQISAI